VFRRHQRGRRLASMGPRLVQLGLELYLTLAQLCRPLVLLGERGSLLLLLEIAELTLERADHLRANKPGFAGLQLESRRRLIHHINGLVRKEAIVDIAVGQFDRCLKRLVGDLDGVVPLVVLADNAQHSKGFVNRWLAYLDRLEATLQGGILFDVLAILVERRGTDAAQLATRQGRLEQVRRANGTLGVTGADDGM